MESMNLAQALKTMAKRSKLTYKDWGAKAGGVAASTITTPIERNDAKVSTLIRLANAAGYDVLLVRRHSLEPEEPILIDSVGRAEKHKED